MSDITFVGDLVYVTDTTLKGSLVTVLQGYKNSIVLTLDKQSIIADDNDIATITARVLDYDGILITDYDDVINFVVNGDIYQELCVGGIADIEISSAVAGVISVSTQNSMVNNGGCMINAT